MQVSTSSGFSSTIVNQSGITDSLYGISGLSNSTTYYWRVNATNAYGTSAWSTVRSFATEAAAQDLLSNGGFESGSSPWEFWTTGSGDFSTGTPAYAGSSAAIVSVTNVGTNCQLRQCEMLLNPNTSYTVTFAAYSNAVRDMVVEVLKNSAPYTNYGLRDTVSLGTGWGTYQCSFTTTEFSTPTTDTRFRFWLIESGVYHIDAVTFGAPADTTAPAAPTLSWPTNGATEIALSPTVVWNRSSGAASYQLQVSTASSFSSTVFDLSGITDTTRSVSGLSDTTTYYWRVNATNSAGTSAWSSVRNFTTTTSPPISSHNVLTNWDFENGTSPWRWYSNPEVGQFTTGTPAYHGSSAAIVSFSGEPITNQQLYQKSIHLMGETAYRLVFNAYATAGRDMRVYAHLDTLTYANLGLSETVDLETAWKRIELNFTTTNITDSTTHGELRFWFVDNAVQYDVYHIDSVSLYAVTQDTIQPEPLTELLITPGREQFLDDEPVLFDASLSQGGTITGYKWYIDNVYVTDSCKLMRYFPVTEAEGSKQIVVRLEIRFTVNGYEYTDDKTVTILIKKRPKSYYYLTDHLGSIRATVRGGEKMLVDDFETGELLGYWKLPQWTELLGFGFRIYQGQLTHQSDSAHVLVNACDDVLTDGIAAVDVKLGNAAAHGSLVVRHANSYYYAVEVQNDSINIIKVRPWDSRVMAAHKFNPTISLNQVHRLQVTAENNAISVSWHGTQILKWTDTGTGQDAPLMSGKVGFAHAGGGPEFGILWDNIVVTSGVPGQVITAEDYDPWGLVLDGKSYVYGNPDQRYKFTGKERDAETGYDYFGARYYDARIGRWTAVDPLGFIHPDETPYAYCLNSPIFYVDRWGLQGDTANSNKSWLPIIIPPTLPQIDILPLQPLTWVMPQASLTDPVLSGVQGASVAESGLSNALGTVGLVGFASGAGEVGLYNEYGWFSLSRMEYFPRRVTGNQYIGSRSVTGELVRPLKITTRGAFLVGTATRAVNAYVEKKQGKDEAIYRLPLEVTIDALATFGGLTGFIVGSAANALLESGCFEGYPEPYWEVPFGVSDATRTNHK